MTLEDAQRLINKAIGLKKQIADLKKADGSIEFRDKKGNLITTLKGDVANLHRAQAINAMSETLSNYIDQVRNDFGLVIDVEV